MATNNTYTPYSAIECNEEYLGCATCQTDMYLMDIEEDEQNGR